MRRVRELHKKTIIPKMCIPTENKILNSVDPKHRKKYPNIIRAYMGDVHEEFDHIMRAYSMQKFLRPAADDFIPPRMPFEFKFAGKTSRYHIYLRNRQLLARNLVIPFPFIRCILNYSKTDFPVTLNDYGAYKLNNKGRQQLLDLNEFYKLAEHDLKDNVMFLKKDWYPKIVKVIRRHYRRHTVAASLWPRIFACANGLINRQITEVKIRTFENIFEMLTNVNKVPILRLDIVYSNYTLDLEPKFMDIFRTYCKIFSDICDIGQNLPSLELQIDSQEMKGCRDFIRAEMERAYMQVVNAKLQSRLRVGFGPVLKYLVQFKKDFLGLTAPEVNNNLTAFLAEPRTFEELLDRIEIFKDFIWRLRSLPQMEYFTMAQVNQTRAISGLRTVAQTYIDRITKNIVLAHQRDCTDICDAFISIRDKAFEVPITTEGLLASGEYMLDMKLIEMKRLQERIQENLRVRKTYQNVNAFILNIYCLFFFPHRLVDY